MSSHNETSAILSRRDALRWLGLSGVAVLAAACSSPSSPSPAAAPTQQAPPQAAGGPQPQGWDDIVSGAKKDGVVTIATYAGTGYRKVMDDFETAFPGVKVEQTGFQSSSRDYVPRLLQERNAGLFLWDIAIMPSVEMLLQVNPVGGIDPLRPLLVRPDVLEDKNWNDGFEGGFVDAHKQLSYAITRARSQSFWIDTNQVQETEFRSYKDVLDPKWKGKLLAGDLRTKGSGYNVGTVLRLKTRDEDILKKMYKDQEAVLSTDARQLTEFAARGSYPISLGAVSKPILLDFIAQGVGKNLKCISFPEFDYFYSGSSLLHFMNKAPHPAAAKLFVNWVLTKDGSATFSKNLQDNSRRVDVPPFDTDTVLPKGEDFTILDLEEILPELQKTQDMARALLN